MDFMKKNDVEKKQENDKKDFLILELQRYHKENGKVPTQKNMQPKNGYSSYMTYVNYFGTWNEALEAAELEVNQYQDHWKDGTETCSYCKKQADEIHNFRHWTYHNNIRYCEKHGYRGTRGLPDYVKGILDINSKVGRGRAGEICVVKALKIGDEYDCNRLSCGYSFDMYNDEYDKIDVKTSVLSNKYNRWIFTFKAKKVADTYICIGMSSNTKHVERVWIVPNEGKIIDLIDFRISNRNLGLRNHKKWEVNAKIYDIAWKEMLNNYTDGKCKVFGKKGD